MRFFLACFMLATVFVIEGCSGGYNPQTPDIYSPVIYQRITNQYNRHILGAWELTFDFEKFTAEAVPLRLAEGHFNVRKFMENGPCYTCLQLLNFKPQPDNTFFIDVQLTHPFPGLDNFTGFDVRGIAIFNGSYVFPTSGLIMSDRALGNVELINADGYTTVFNPVNYPEGSNLPILTYSKGKLAGNLFAPATLNGYKAFFPNQPRRIFRAGDTDFQTYHIARPPTILLKAGYVVDACWEQPIKKPVENPLTDFGPNANCLEAYQVSASINPGMMPGCGTALYQVDVYDHQGFSTIAGISIEAPDLFNGWLNNSSGTNMGSFTRFTGYLPNEHEVGSGKYRVLIKVNDKMSDPFLGQVSAFAITYATVSPAPIDYEHGWRKHGRTLDNHNHNQYETELKPQLTEIWTYQLPSGTYKDFSSTPVIGSYAVYVLADISFNQRVWALSLDTGEMLWNAMIKFENDIWIYRGVPTVGNCELYVPGSAFLVYDSEDGDALWNYDKDNTQYIAGSPVVLEDKIIFWGNNNTLYAINRNSGEFIWSYSTGPKDGNPSTPVVDGNVVYAGDVSGYAFALNLENGSEIWKVQFPKGGPIPMNDIRAQPVLADGLILFASYNCHLYGLDPLDGSIELDFPLNDQLPYAGPAYDGMHIYQPTAYYPPYGTSYTQPYKVIAFNKVGSKVWEFSGTDEEAFFSTPAVANGIVWVASDAGRLYMLDSVTGSKVGQGAYDFGNPITSGVSIQNGRLYLIDSSGKVHCMGSE